MEAQQLASMIDHTLLKPEATSFQIDQLCDEALEYEFWAVCVNPCYVPRAADRLAGSGVRIATVVGFPLGATLAATKIDETKEAIAAGADEIDMVLHLGRLIAGELSEVRDEIAGVADVVHGASAQHVIKVILETAALTPEQIAQGCQCCVGGRADFVKTSTGFHPAGGATADVVRMLKRLAAPLKVKAAGGIGDLPKVQDMINAGADRLGMSASVAVMNQL